VLNTSEVADQIRLAFAGPDLELLAPLLHPKVRWGAGPQPRACRSRADVLVTFARLLGDGVSGEVIDLQVLPGGVVAHLRVRWPEPQPEDARLEVFQSYRVVEGLVIEIEGHEDQQAAAHALS
jgi:hypothetical protein